MNVLKIVVDELPKTCHDCELIENYDTSESDCSITHRVASSRSRRFDCPLVIEEVCEWHIKQTGQMWDENNPIYTQKRSCYKEAHYAGTLPLSNICSNCGKPIKYIESE